MQELWVREQQAPTIACGWGLVGARLIFDTNVTLSSYDGGPTHVMS
jgi:hypothetical protein